MSDEHEQEFDLVEALMVEASAVLSECFPSGNVVEMKEALAFLLGLTPSGADRLAAIIGDAVDSEARPDASRHLVFQLTLFHSVIFGVAAQRLNAIEVLT